MVYYNVMRRQESTSWLHKRQIPSEELQPQPFPSISPIPKSANNNGNVASSNTTTGNNKKSSGFDIKTTGIIAGVLVVIGLLIGLFIRRKRLRKNTRNIKIDDNEWIGRSSSEKPPRPPRPSQRIRDAFNEQEMRDAFNAQDMEREKYQPSIVYQDSQFNSPPYFDNNNNNNISNKRSSPPESNNISTNSYESNSNLLQSKNSVEMSSNSVSNSSLYSSPSNYQNYQQNEASYSTDSYGLNQLNFTPSIPHQQNSNETRGISPPFPHKRQKSPSNSNLSPSSSSIYFQGDPAPTINTLNDQNIQPLEDPPRSPFFNEPVPTYTLNDQNVPIEDPLRSPFLPFYDQQDNRPLEDPPRSPFFKGEPAYNKQDTRPLEDPPRSPYLKEPVPTYTLNDQNVPIEDPLRSPFFQGVPFYDQQDTRPLEDPPRSPFFKGEPAYDQQDNRPLEDPPRSPFFKGEPAYDQQDTRPIEDPLRSPYLKEPVPTYTLNDQNVPIEDPLRSPLFQGVPFYDQQDTRPLEYSPRSPRSPHFKEPVPTNTLNDQNVPIEDPPRSPFFQGEPFYNQQDTRPLEDSPRSPYFKEPVPTNTLNDQNGPIEDPPRSPFFQREPVYDQQDTRLIEDPPRSPFFQGEPVYDQQDTRPLEDPKIEPVYDQQDTRPLEYSPRSPHFKEPVPTNTLNDQNGPIEDPPRSPFFQGEPVYDQQDTRPLEYSPRSPHFKEPVSTHTLNDQNGPIEDPPRSPFFKGEPAYDQQDNRPLEDPPRSPFFKVEPAYDHQDTRSFEDLPHSPLFSKEEPASNHTLNGLLEDPPHSPLLLKGEPISTSTHTNDYQDTRSLEDPPILSVSAHANDQSFEDPPRSPLLLSPTINDNNNDDFNDENNNNISYEGNEDLSTNSNIDKSDDVRTQFDSGLDDIIAQFNFIIKDDGIKNDLPSSPTKPSKNNDTIAPDSIKFSKDSSYFDDSLLTMISSGISSNVAPTISDEESKRRYSQVNDYSYDDESRTSSVNINHNVQMDYVQPIQGMIQIETLNDYKITNNNIPKESIKINLQDIPIESIESQPGLDSPRLMQPAMEFIEPTQSNMVIEYEDNGSPLVINLSSSPSTQYSPSTPSTPSMPSTPSTQSTPFMPSTPSTPSTPSVTSNVQPRMMQPVAQSNMNPTPPRYDIDSIKRHAERVLKLKTARKVESNSESATENNNDESSNKETQEKPIVRKKSVRFQTDSDNNKETLKVPSSKSILINKNDVINIQDTMQQSQTFESGYNYGPEDKEANHRNSASSYQLYDFDIASYQDNTSYNY